MIYGCKLLCVIPPPTAIDLLLLNPDDVPGSVVHWPVDPAVILVSILYGIGFLCDGISATVNVYIHSHTLRHSFATDLLKNNTNIVHVKELLGHASIQATMAYTHAVNGDLHQIHRLKHTVVHTS